MEIPSEDNLITKSGEKRKRGNIDENVPRKKKKSGNKIKPPTAEEINRLRETENVFHSNLFRLQIEETLKEVKIKDATIEKITSFLEKLGQFLVAIELPISVKLSANETLNIPGIVSPMKNKSKYAEINFKFLNPLSTMIIGSFGIGGVMKGFTNIDLAVIMPKGVFLQEDYLNEKYLRKRSHYLCCIASKLQESLHDLLIDSNIQFSVRSYEDKPVLLIKPSEEKLKKFNIFLHLLPEEGTFKETRFSPTHNNVRYGWYFNSEAGNGKLNFPTPYYNSLIGQDLVALKNEEIRKETFSNNSNFKEAFVLLKIWLHQRKMDEGLGSFSGYLISMFMTYLNKNRKLNQYMSSYQIIRNVWVALDQTNWHTDGISLFDFKEESIKDYQLFKNAYDIVFVDVTGSINLASGLSLNSYLRVKSESKYAVECLDNQNANFYPALFMTPVSFLQYCDHIICFNKMSVIRKTVELYSEPQTRLDFRDNIILQFIKIISEMLKKSLGNRIFEIFHYIEPTVFNWPISDKKARPKKILFGLRINPEFAYNIIDKGPVANLPEAEEFRKFWADKSELRRFRDGSVCETVCWAASNDSLKKKRTIVRNIVQYILQCKFQLQTDQYTYVIDQVENVLYDSLQSIFQLDGTNEEVTLNLLSSFDGLSKQLRQLDDVPLAITSVQGISPIFRYSEPFPLLANASTTLKKATTFQNNVAVFKDGQILKHMPLFVPPIEVVIHFSVTNKWPEDLGAIRRLQAAFYLKLSLIAKEKFNYLSVPYTTHLDLLKDGYIFRLKISNNSEIAAVKRIVNEEGMIEYCDNEESLYLEKKVIQLPTLNSAIHGLHQQFPAFGCACVISKRWLRSHLIDDYHFADICVDFLLGYLFSYPQPYFTAYQPQTMFLRFLNLLSSTNWHIEPIIVNFNNELSRDDIVEIDSYFNSNRSKLPPLFIATPFDKSGVTWTKEEPSVVVLSRVAKLAEAALRSLETALLLKNNYDVVQQIFRPPLKGYDLLIWTKYAINPLRWMAIGADKNSLPSIKTSIDYDKLPILDFHPVKLFVDELRKNYNECCIFLYDFYGGNVIGVVLKPTCKQSKEFKVTNMKCCKIIDNKMTLDIDALIDDFYILGKGVVSHIDKCNENK